MNRRASDQYPTNLYSRAVRAGRRHKRIVQSIRILLAIVLVGGAAVWRHSASADQVPGPNTSGLQANALYGFMHTTSVSPQTVAPGASSTITTAIMPMQMPLVNGVVDIEIYNAANQKVGQQYWVDQSIGVDETQVRSYTWTAQLPGIYRVAVGVFGPKWAPNYLWASKEASISVTSTAKGTSAVSAMSAPQISANTTSGLGTVTVTGVATNNSSAKIDFQPYPGAADYRVYDVSNPTHVKYAGQVFNGSAMAPATEVEWNSLDDNQAHTLVVQAVNQLGPVPQANLYDSNNQPVVSPLPSGAMLGGNSGATGDGNISINGQGPYTNNPTVLAQSAPFVVQANRGVLAIPSSSDAVQTFFDTFDSSEGQPVLVSGPDPSAGTATYTYAAGTSHPWKIQEFAVDTKDTMPFQKDGHMMDMVFDGGTPGTNIPLHQQYSSINYEPQVPVDLSGGKLVHLTMEVDQHVDSRRWVQWYILPHGDAFTGNHITVGNLDSSNTGLDALLTPGGCVIDDYTGPAGSSGPPNHVELAGAAGQGQTYCGANYGPYGQGDGSGLDNRTRVDFFFTSTQYALFADGHQVVNGSISPALPFTSADIYISHYLYHSDNEVNELQTYRPYETYWINQVPYSDERHWDNMGFEVLPANDVPSDWSTLSSRIHMPAFVAPTTSSVTPTATTAPASPSATATAMPGTSTSTPVPPTATSTNSPVPPAPVPPTATNTAITVTATSTNTPLPTSTSAPPTAAPASISTLGYTATAGGQFDTGTNNNLSAVRVTTGAGGASVTSMSAYVGPIDASNPAYGLAIYTDSGGYPNALVASASGMLTGSGWNTLPLTANLAANTTYWLVYNSATSNSSMDEVYYVNGAANMGDYSPTVACCAFPATMGGWSAGNLQYAMYATLGAGATATPTSTSVPPTATSTNSPVPPTSTATGTPIPPSPTATNTQTATATNTPVPPSATATKAPVRRKH